MSSVKEKKIKTDKKRKSGKKKGLFFRFIAFFFRLFYKKSEFLELENLPSEPCIIVGNHAKIHGPLMGELYFPLKKLIWCDGPMFNRKEFSKYAYDNFFGGKPNWFYKIAMKILAPLVSYVFRNADALPVYRDMRVMRTYKQTVEALNDGFNIIIFPECPEIKNDIVNQFNEYFVDVARFFYKHNKKELKFAPMYYAAELRKVVFGKPITFDSAKPIDEQRKVVCEYLMNEMTALAKSLPSHTVIPFHQVPKDQFKKSK